MTNESDTIKSGSLPIFSETSKHSSSDVCKMTFEQFKNLKNQEQEK